MPRRSKPQGSKKNPKSKNKQKGPDHQYFMLMFAPKEKAMDRALTKPGRMEILRSNKKNGKMEAWGEVSSDVFPYQYAYDPKTTTRKVRYWSLKRLATYGWERIIEKANTPDPKPPSYAFSCPGCKAGFNTEIELIDHYAAITGWGCLKKSWTNPAPGERRSCSVPKCNIKVRNFEKFKEHCFSTHWKWKQCAECDSHLPDVTQLKVHKVLNCKPLASHPDLVEVCWWPSCTTALPKNAPTPKHNHWVLNHAPLWHCPLCEHQFTQAPALKQHFENPNYFLCVQFVREQAAQA